MDANNTADRNGSVLVIGGTGKTGRRVAERLGKRGRSVRIGSRRSDTPFDWEQPSTWGPALRGVSAAYVTYYPDLAAPGSAEAIAKLSAVALSEGVKRLVLLSGRGEPGAQLAEQALRDSGAEWTIVRASWFMQNFSENFMLDAILAGELALPVGDVREPFIDADDIADVVVEAIQDRRHIGQLYEVTGPRLLTFAEAIRTIADTAGRPVRFVRISVEEFVAGLQAQQAPPDLIELLTDLFTNVLDGRNASLGDGVQRALGRPACDLNDYARDAAPVWRSGPQPG